MHVLIIKALLRENRKLENDNIALKKQIQDTKVRKVAREVARNVDDWLNRPYEDEKSVYQDIADFALQITRDIDHRLRD